MDEGGSPGTIIYPVPQPTAMTASVRQHSRTRSQITTVDIDLANALSVAPAPHSWKDAEERVLSEFGDNFSTPTSPEARPPSPHKEYFVGDLECVSRKGLGIASFSLFCDRSLYIHKTTTASRLEVFGVLPHACVRARFNGP
jgi:hypothetical protein